MFHDRKEYRKKINAEGLLHIGGETLRVNCYDVSLKGVMVVIHPGKLLVDVEDFEALMLENRHGEVFIEALTLAGDVEIVWVKRDHERLMMGLAFQDVMHHAEKLWRKRRGYRKTESFEAEMRIDKRYFNLEGINRSTEGMCLRLVAVDHEIKVGEPVKLFVPQFHLTAMGKVVWADSGELSCRFGLQLITL